jgi:hypothetical protein
MCLSKSLIFRIRAPRRYNLSRRPIFLRWMVLSTSRMEALQQEGTAFRAVETVARDSCILGDFEGGVWRGRRWTYGVCRVVKLRVLFA